MRDLNVGDKITVSKIEWHFVNFMYLSSGVVLGALIYYFIQQ